MAILYYVCVYVQMGVKTRDLTLTLSQRLLGVTGTQPCGEQVLSTLWVHCVKKSLIERQVECSIPMSDSLFISLWGRMVIRQS